MRFLKAFPQSGGRTIQNIMLSGVLCLTACAALIPIVGNSYSASSAVGSANQFALDLYRQEQHQWTDQNLLFSPYSIVSALAMTYAGAGGNTKAQMAKVLHVGQASDIAVHRGFAELQKTITRHSGLDYQVHLTNALWLPDDNTAWISKLFLDTLHNFYSARPQALPFNSEPEQARLAINQWVSQQTVGKIQDLLAPGAVDRNTRLVLTNAIYFKDSWRIPFPKHATQDLSFSTPSGTVKVPTMQMTADLPYFENESVQALSLPYQFSEFMMTIFLPKPGQDLNNLPFDTLIPLVSLAFRPISVDVRLPKFRVESAIDLRADLQALNMQDAFDPRLANFSVLAEKGQYWLSAVLHKAFIDVNEYGTEAAAATAVTAMRGMDSHTPPLVRFYVDKPFLFLITTQAGVPIFLGRIMYIQP